MAAENNSKKYCTKLDTYNTENFVFLIYAQPAADTRGRVTFTDMNGDILEDYDKLTTKITKDLMKKIVQIINKNNVCSNIVNQDFVNYNHLIKNTIYMVLFDTKKKTTIYPSNIKGLTQVKKIIKSIGKPIAFILAHDKLGDDAGNHVKEAYIDILCACPGSGKTLLNYFISSAEKNGTYTAVSLSAIPTVLTYYPGFYFSHRKACLVGAEKIIPNKHLIALAKTGRYKYTEDIYRDPQFLEYLIELRDNGYGKIDGNCAKANITSHEMNEAKCGDDGYIMRRCLKIEKNE